MLNSVGSIYLDRNIAVCWGMFWRTSLLCQQDPKEDLLKEIPRFNPGNIPRFIPGNIPGCCFGAQQQDFWVHLPKEVPSFIPGNIPRFIPGNILGCCFGAETPALPAGSQSASSQRDPQLYSRLLF